MALAIIAAVGRGGVIGSGGRTPWHLPEDLRHFRRLTMGHAVVMGRRTFESIGKPLDGRRNIVLTKEAGWQHKGVEAARSLEEALELAGDDAFIIGGGEVYCQAIPLVDKLCLTYVYGDWTGDTFFPPVDPALWREVSREPHEGFEFVEYIKQ